MQIFVKKLQGMAITLTLNVESCETINSVKRKLEVKEEICSDVVQILFYEGKHLDDLRTLADYNILKDSTLHLLTRKRLPHIYVKTMKMIRSIITLSIVDLNTIDDIKAKLYEQEGIPPDEQRLFFNGRQLDGNQTLLENHIIMESTLLLHIGTIMNREGRQSAPSELTQVNVSSQDKRPAPQVAPKPTKRARLATQTTTSKATPSSHSIFDTSDLMPEFRVRPPSSVMTELEDVKCELATVRSMEKELEATILSIRQKFASYDSQIVALKAENKETKEELTVSHNKEKELEVTISRLRQKCASYESQVVALKDENKEIEKELTVARSKEKDLGASYKSQIVALEAEKKERKEKLTVSQIVALEAEVKKTKEELAVSHSKEKEQEATISNLMHKNKALSAQCASYFRQVFALEAENKKTTEVLMVARSKEKEQEATISDLTNKSKVFSDQLVALEAENKKTRQELTEQEATISRLTHKNKVFSAQCASYESQVVALEAENKKTKGELMNADKKYYSGARAAGYAEGLKEGKAKWLKSVEFLHHLTDASMQYFDYGFESCRNQAEQQGFVGQLNKESALKDAPEIKRPTPLSADP